MKNIVLAAGYATRMYPLTENFPKPLLPVGSSTILDKMLEDVDALDEIDEHIIVTNHRFIGIFEESRALFTDMNMTDVITLRTMEADFGVIPWPKYDEGSEYCTNVDAGTNLFLVPITASDPARTSVILESLCRIGSRLVLPAYYEVTLQSKTSRDNESADMLDIIKSALIFDLGYYNSDLSGVFNNEFVDFVGSSNRDITSWYEKSAKAVNKTLEKNIDKYRD